MSLVWPAALTPMMVGAALLLNSCNAVDGSAVAQRYYHQVIRANELNLPDGRRYWMRFEPERGAQLPRVRRDQALSV